jgi:hypothetical protein
MSFIFLLIKVYAEICTVSMFMRIRSEKAKEPVPFEAAKTVYQDNSATAV